MLASMHARVFLVALLLVPLASAEFGPESPEGWPIGMSGEIQRPPVLGEVVSVNPLQPNVEPLNKVGPLTIYPYYPLLTAEVQRLARDHAGLVELSSAGTSTAGLSVWKLHIANFQDKDKADFIPLEEREVIYIDGGTHSNEYSGVYFVTEIAQFLLDEYATNATAKWIVDNRDITIVPMVNPDGSNAFGRLNAKGVNVNRNFPGTWGTVDEDPVLNNPGPAPESEPETRIVTALLDELQPDYANSIHCCGNLWLFPYGAESLGLAPDYQMFSRVCDEVFADVREDCGPIWSTIYPASGTTADEGYVRIGAASWTYEMSGRGAIVGPWGEPAVNTDVRVQERESWRGILHAMLNVQNYGANPHLVGVKGTASVLVFTIHNQGWGNLTAGTIALGDVQVPLPFIAAGETVQVSLPGNFEAGPVDVQVTFTKRILNAPQESRTIHLDLVSLDGNLVWPAKEYQSAEAKSSPAPGLLLLAAGFAVATVVLRRR